MNINPAHKVKVVPCNAYVNESERKAIAQIKDRLIGVQVEDQWMLLTNLAFHTGSTGSRRQPDEIDIVVIGPPGITIVEVKHWSAAWVDRHQEIVEQAAKLVNEKTGRVGTTLRKNVQDLGYVRGVFLVTEEGDKVRKLKGRSSQGIPFYTLAKDLKDAIGLNSSKVLSDKQVETLARMLAPRNVAAANGALKHLGDYTRLELKTPKNQRFHRIYKGVHSSRQDRVLLHFYDFSTNDEPNAKDKAEREFKTLHRLQLHRWAPRIIDSFQDAPGYPGEIKFFTVADPTAPSIEERASDHSWDTKAKLEFARNTVHALREFHEVDTDEQPMIHRNLTRKTILIKNDNSPIFTGFEYARIPADVTVVSSSTLGDQWDDATAPEVRSGGRGAASRQSDVYSLSSCLITLFSREDEPLSRSTKEALAEALDNNPGARICLADLEVRLSDLLSNGQASTPPPPQIPAQYWTEDQIVHFRGQDYKIISHLGTGGAGKAFKVVKFDRKTGEERGTYVAKVVFNEEAGKQALKAYEQAHSYLRHSALSTIFEVAPEWCDTSFIALMTWINGEPLDDWAIMPFSDEDVPEVLGWIKDALKALDVLHGNGLVHGDVSPRNMIVSSNNLVLTDYDLVAKIGELTIRPGTMPYCAPGSPEGRIAAPADDIYALAASFFKVLFKREPFQYGEIQAKEKGLNWEDLEQERQVFGSIPEFLHQATHPDPERRFQTVREAMAALSPSSQIERDTEQAAENKSDINALSESQLPTHLMVERTQLQENEVDWLKSLLQSYPGSLRGNSETRGLDTDFAERTYVRTDLENRLYDDIKKRKIRLVVLCGNAGDGKTALLQHLAKRLELSCDHASRNRILRGKTNDGLTVAMNLDGSASAGSQSANDLLNTFLEPFQNGRPKKDIVHLLAINDGRLLEWIEYYDSKEGETPLTKDLAECLEQQSSPPDSHLRFISLNQRSLVTSLSRDNKTIKADFLERLLDNLYGGENATKIWKPCSTCSAQGRCEVLRATKLFGPDSLANVLPNMMPKENRDRARQRLAEMLQAVHLRGETQITIRELRATVTYILFGLHFCEDYHDGKDVLPYWDRAFSPHAPGRQGEVLRELIRFDPALDSHPKIDRTLLHGQSRMTLASARRQAYFEWSEAEIKALDPDPHALGLAQGRHFRRFRDLVTLEEEKRSGLCKELCKGMSRLEDLPPKAERTNVVPLRITPRTPTETAFWIEKNITDFRLETEERSATVGGDWLHRQAFLIYRYRDGKEERLHLGADLFHRLLELANGYQLGDASTEDTFAHLSIFVQRLVREDDRRLLAWNPMQDEAIYEVSVQMPQGDDVKSPQRMQIQKLPPLEEN